MEYINKVELQGYIGPPTISYMKDKRVARFSLATQYVFKGVEGSLLSETTWFDCIAFENENIDFSIIQTGNTLNVTGRLREKRYVTSEGIERRIFEIICQSVKLAE